MKYKLIGPIICAPEDTMQTNKCPKLFTASSYAFECKSLFQASTQLDRRAVIKHSLEDAFKNGINFFHIGGLQHETEAMEIFSESVQNFIDKLIISSTYNIIQPLHKIEEVVLRNCEQLRTQCVDVLYLDCNNDARGDVAPAMLVFRQLLNAGKINGAGLSNASPEQIERANKIFPLTIVRNDYNSLSEKIFDKKIINFCKISGIIFSAHTNLNEENFLCDQSRVIEKIAKKYGFAFKKIILIWMISQGFIPCIDITSSGCLTDCISISSTELASGELKQLTSVFEVMAISQCEYSPKLGCY